jgi:hypothetical protein
MRAANTVIAWRLLISGISKNGFTFGKRSSRAN